MRLKKFNEMFDPMGSWDPRQLDNTEKQVSGLIDKLIEQLPYGVKVESSSDKSCQLIVNYGPSNNGYKNFIFNITIVDGEYVIIYEIPGVNGGSSTTDNLGQGSLERTLSTIETWNDLE